MNDGADLSTEIVDRDGDVVLIACRSASGDMQVLANLQRFGDAVVLDKLHADGAGPNTLGLSVLRAFAQHFCALQGVRTLIVNGAPRTTGASPGKRTMLTFRFGVKDQC